jgi:hypothetical protein
VFYISESSVRNATALFENRKQLRRFPYAVTRQAQQRLSKAARCQLPMDFGATILGEGIGQLKEKLESTKLKV